MTQINQCDRAPGLDSFVQKNCIEHPKFTFGDVVECPYVSDDDGKPYKDVGIVQGLFYSEVKAGWVYWVKWAEIERMPDLPAPIFEEADESWLMSCRDEAAGLSPCYKKSD